MNIEEITVLADCNEEKHMKTKTKANANKKKKLVLVLVEDKNDAFNIDETTIFSSAQKTILATKTKSQEWICQGVPCIILSEDGDTVKIKPFNKAGIYTVSRETFAQHFRYLERDNDFVYTELYPGGKIPINEFKIQPISINYLKKHFKDYTSFVKLLEKAELDSYCGKGSSFCINIKSFLEYNEIGDVQGKNKLERVGDPIFNRTVRHTTPISNSFTYEDFEKSPSFPAPIGIRAEDFAFPSEQNEIFLEMLTQIFNSKNAPECPTEFLDELGITISPSSHKCEWCGEIMDISGINQEYCSRVHSINFCHRDPVLGTKKGNVYLGHCSCNREQGGYSEEQRTQQIIRLAKHNSYYREILLKELM